MARQCEACGKKVQMGNRVETRGKAKYLGGVGTKITGITRRKFVPNLQKVHVTLAQRHQQIDAGLRSVHSQRRGSQDGQDQAV